MSIFRREPIRRLPGTYGSGTWVRVAAGFYSLPVEALVGDIADARGIDLAGLGFGRMATTPGPQTIPRLDNVVLDLASRVDADLCLSDDLGRPIGLLFGATFQEPHPDQWWNSTHSRGSVTVVLGPTQEIMQDLPETLTEFVALLKTMWVAEVPLLVRGWETGVGSHNEAPNREDISYSLQRTAARDLEPSGQGVGLGVVRELSDALDLNAQMSQEASPSAGYPGYFATTFSFRLSKIGSVHDGDR